MAPKHLGPGDEAPNFTLSTQTGERWELRPALERGPVLVYFYPKDETPGCTVEACKFRDAYPDFSKHAVEVVGISRDSVSSHEKFAGHHSLPFTLLSDPDGAVRNLFGVKKTLGLWDGRVSFLIGRDGKVQHAFSSALNPIAHVQRALDAVDKLEKSRTQ